jgi:hypothetical protein
MCPGGRNKAAESLVAYAHCLPFQNQEACANRLTRCDDSNVVASRISLVSVQPERNIVMHRLIPSGTQVDRSRHAITCFFCPFAGFIRRQRLFFPLLAFVLITLIVRRKA